MRAVIQKVSKAKVLVNQVSVGAIDHGLLVFLGIEHEDLQSDADWLIKKLCKMRLFEDANGVLNLSVQECNGAFLVVSLFTLHASTKKGNRPSYYKAAKPEYAKQLYDYFIEQLWNVSNLPVRNGEFGAHMEVDFVNNGPVTILMDSKNKE